VGEPISINPHVQAAQPQLHDLDWQCVPALRCSDTV